MQLVLFGFFIVAVLAAQTQAIILTRTALSMTDGQITVILVADEPIIPTVGVYVNSNRGSGCVALVRDYCSGLNNRATTSWIKGIQVKGNCDSIAVGTAIATFDGTGGKYNSTRFQHTAIFGGGCTTNGFKVYDQWVDKLTGVKVGVRNRFLYYLGTKSNGASNFYVIN